MQACREALLRGRHGAASGPKECLSAANFFPTRDLRARRGPRVKHSKRVKAAFAPAPRAMLDRKRSARSHFYKIGGVGILRALATFPPRDASMELAFAQPGPNTLLVMFKARGDGSLSFQLGDGSSGRVDLHDRLPLPELDVAGTKALRYGRIVTLDENTLAVSVQHVVVKSVWGWGAGSNEASVGAARAPPVAARELAVFADLAKSPHANLMSPLVTGVDCWGTVHMVLPCGSADLMDCILHTVRSPLACAPVGVVCQHICPSLC